MDTKLIKIIYHSKATKLLSDNELEDMLCKARENNSKSSITGLLIVKGYSFFQWLEGNEKDVIELFEKIKTDNRHHSVFLMDKDIISSREFACWDMGYKNIDKLKKLESEKLKDFSEDWNSQELPKIFKSFLKTNVL
jgi:hypothetical protein